MLSVKLLVFFSFQILSTFGFEGNPNINLPEINLENLNWPQQKLDTLRVILSTLAEVGNVTLVGWQNVLNTDGSLKQIKTIELTVIYQGPLVLKSHPEYINNKEVLPEIVELKNKMYKRTGILLSGSVQQWSLDKSPSNLLIVNQNQDVFIWNHGVIYGLRNITVNSLQEVVMFAKLLKIQTNLPVGVLKWNDNEELDMNSIVVPQLLASVVSAKNATPLMLDIAITGISKAYLVQPDNMLRFVSLYMKKYVPGYKWHISQGNNWISLQSDIEIIVKYAHVPIGQGDIVLSLYGVMMN